MKKTILAAVLTLALGVSGVTFAHDAPESNSADTPSATQPRHHHHHAKFFNKLNLSKDQKAQVRDIMKKQHEEAMTQVRAILTPEQQKTFDEQQTKMQEKHQKKQMENSK